MREVLDNKHLITTLNDVLNLGITGLFFAISGPIFKIITGIQIAVELAETIKNIIDFYA